MLLLLRVILSSFLLFTFCSCGHGQTNVIVEGLPAPNGTVLYEVLGRLQGDIILVEDTIDLQNKACTIPEGCLLMIKGGYIKNGTLIGDKTRLKSSKACFDRVRILGTWNVPVIKSSFFDDLTYDNALMDVVALADGSVNNKIYIGKGNYQVTAHRNGDVCIPLMSNTELILDGDVWLTPNDFHNSNIIRATGKNIKILGKGSVVGDKHTHTGDSGEWGMGIDVENAHHVLISGLTIRDCWGDCIYIGSKSTDVKIEGCTLDHGRRQGISITSANGVLIKNCVIKNVSGTAPEFAIDVEPNRNCVVDNVVINNVTSIDCKGGVKATSYANNARIGSVIIRNCDISANEHFALKFVKCDKVILDNSKVFQTRKRRIVNCKNVDHLVIRKNTLQYGEGMVEKIKSKVKGAVMNDTCQLIGLINCNNPLIEDNKYINGVKYRVRKGNQKLQ